MRSAHLLIYIHPFNNPTPRSIYHPGPHAARLPITNNSINAPFHISDLLTFQSFYFHFRLRCPMSKRFSSYFWERGGGRALGTIGYLDGRFISSSFLGVERSEKRRTISYHYYMTDLNILNFHKRQKTNLTAIRDHVFVNVK